jgi:hypothetical protein
MQQRSQLCRIQTSTFIEAVATTGPSTTLGGRRTGTVGQAGVGKGRADQAGVGVAAGRVASTCSSLGRMARSGVLQDRSLLLHGAYMQDPLQEGSGRVTLQVRVRRQKFPKAPLPMVLLVRDGAGYPSSVFTLELQRSSSSW